MCIVTHVYYNYTGSHSSKKDPCFIKISVYIRLSPVHHLFWKSYPQYSNLLSPVHCPVGLTGNNSAIVDLILTRFCTVKFKWKINRSVDSVFCWMCINSENNDKYWHRSDYGQWSKPFFQSFRKNYWFSWRQCGHICLKTILQFMFNLFLRGY